MPPGRVLLLLFVLVALPANASVDLLRLEQEVTLDPDTGAVQGRAVVLADAGGGAVSQVALILDRGLSVTGATINAGTVSIQQSLYQQFRYVQLSLSPSVNATFSLTVDYAGTAECPRAGSSSYCDLGAQNRVARFMTGSVFPWFVTEDGPDILEHALTLHTPAGMPLVVSAEPVQQSESQGVRTSSWKVDRAVPNGLDVYLGALESTVVPGVATPVVTIHNAQGDDAWTAPLLEWVPDIVAFHEARMQAPLPFTHISLLKLPSYLGTFGHTSLGHICLSDWHGSGPASVFEEMWAHEFAHLWWGVAVMPKDFERQKLITEGLAVLAQLDYGAARLPMPAAREAYLARRNRESELLMRYVVRPGSIPAVVAPTAAQVPPRAYAIGWWTWAYANTAAVLDYVRTHVGEDAFAAGLRRFAKGCAHARCDVASFEQALSTETGRDLSALFMRWVYDGRPAELRVGFTETTSPDGRQRVAVTLRQKGLRTTPLELWVALQDGRSQRHQVVLEAEQQTFELEVDGAVRAVQPNPRQLPLLWAESMVEGDVNFDGEVDGRDVLHCARLVGKTVSATWVIGESAVGVDLDFDPRCDLLRDGALGEADLSALAGLFPNVRMRR